MKKIISTLLVTLLLASAIFGCFSASAAGTGLPTYGPEQDVVLTSGTSKFWMNSLNGGAKLRDHVFSTAVVSTYNDLPIVKSSAVSGVSTIYNQKTIFLQFGLAQIGTTNKAITVNGAYSNNGYKVIMAYFEISSTAGPVNSFIITTAMDDIFGNIVPDGFTLYASDTLWNETSSYKVLKDQPTSTAFTPVARVTGLNTENKWVNATTGDYKYYEANFSQPVTQKFITVCFLAEDLSTIKNLNSSKEYAGTNMGISEVAFFEGSIQGAETAPIPEVLPEDKDAAEAEINLVASGATDKRITAVCTEYITAVRSAATTTKAGLNKIKEESKPAIELAITKVAAEAAVLEKLGSSAVAADQTIASTAIANIWAATSKSQVTTIQGQAIADLGGTPKTGDYTVWFVVAAVVSLFGTAVVTKKKFF